jgi:acetyl-CoA C-acetyltransferase
LVFLYLGLEEKEVGAMPEAVIVSYARTPIGRAGKGSLVDCRPDDLSAHVIRAAIDRVPDLDPGEIEDVIWGTAQPAGEAGYNVARAAALLAGLPAASGVTVNRFCASSLQSIRMAAHAVRAGEGNAFVCGGVDTVSRFGSGMADVGPHNPAFAAAEERSAAAATGGCDWAPEPGLPDYYIAMGQTAENVRTLEQVSRVAMDEFAALSQARAVEAQRNGFFDREIASVEVPGGRVVSADDCPRPGTTVEALAGLKPAFRPDGEVTAGNSCPLNDGAAAVVVMSDLRARVLGIRPLARIVSTAVSALNPEIMGLGPVEACRKALATAQLSMSDIDLMEINEAFAAQVIPCARHLGIPAEKLNVHGGAIALGHPFGMTGARIMGTLLNGLAERGGRFGLESMCIGGGQGMAAVVELLEQ